MAIFHEAHFESTTSTNSITPAYVCLDIYHCLQSVRSGKKSIHCTVSCCGTRCSRCRQSGILAHRPRPLAQVASSATGGAPVAPQFHHTGRCFASIHHLCENSKRNFAPAGAYFAAAVFRQRFLHIFVSKTKKRWYNTKNDQRRNCYEMDDRIGYSRFGVLLQGTGKSI